MSSIKGFFLGWGSPAGLALLLALAGAAALGPRQVRSAGRTVTVVDRSSSCQPPSAPLPGALESRDSDLAAAVQGAAARGAGRIRLYTDGCDITGRAPRLAPHPPVDVALLPRRDDFILLGLRAPERIRTKAPFALRILIGRTEGPGDERALPATVELFRDGERVGTGPRRIRLKRGQRRVLQALDQVDRAGIVRYRAHLRASIGDPANDEAEALVRIGVRPLVLAVGGPVAVAGCDVLTLPPERLAPFLEENGPRVDAILLEGEAPSPAGQRALARAVLGGCGLVVAGTSGFAGRPLAGTLPLTERPPGGRATLFLLDFSGSMERRKRALIAAVERLLEGLDPEEQVAYIAFSGRPVGTGTWGPARSARWDLRRIPTRGQTLLAPALAEARRMLETSRAGSRRLFVISDGAWADIADPELRQMLEELRSRGTYAAALFLEAEGDAGPRNLLFPEHFQAGFDLLKSLRELDRSSPDSLVRGERRARRGAAPAWLEGALPPEGIYRSILRLHARGGAARVALFSGALPLLGAWRKPGGKVVYLAPAPGKNPAIAAALPALTAACLRSAGTIALAARWREGRLAVEVRGKNPPPLRIDGRVVSTRPVAPDLRIARRVEGKRAVCGETILLLPSAGRREWQGLGNRPDIAAAIAARTGGQLFAGWPPAAGSLHPAVHVTLLAAVFFLLLAALLRRKT